MPDLNDIVDRLVSTLREIPTAGTVHDRLRSVVMNGAADYERLISLVPHETDGWRGVFVDAWVTGQRRKSTSDGEALERGQVEVSIEFRIYTLLPYDDEKGSTAAHRQMIWDIAAKLRSRRSLGYGVDVLKHDGYQGSRPSNPIQLSEVWGSGHFSDGGLVVRLITTEANCG